jgi:hypothetical protein
MRTRLSIILFTLLACAQSCLLLPAAAADPIVDRTPAATQLETIAPQACPANAQGVNLAQVAQTDCCKGHKGICGCRAGKIVCCDNTTSTGPGCTCHGDEGFVE